MTTPSQHDAVELTQAIPGWPIGTRGTVVEVLGDDSLVEIVAPDGAMVDLVVLPASWVCARGWNLRAAIAKILADQ